MTLLRTKLEPGHELLTYNQAASGIKRESNCVRLRRCFKREPALPTRETNSYRVQGRRVRFGTRVYIRVSSPSRPRRVGSALWYRGSPKYMSQRPTLVPSNRYTHPRPAVFDNNFHLVPPRDIRVPQRFPVNPTGPASARMSWIHFGAGQRNFFESHAEGTTSVDFCGLCAQFKRLHRSRIGTRRPFAALPRISARRAALTRTAATIYGGEKKSLPAARLSARDKYASLPTDRRTEGKFKAGVR